MPDLFGFPYFEVQFTRTGAVHDESEVRQLLDFLARQPLTDLLVIAHGWNNDLDDARAFHRRFFEHVRRVMDASTVAAIRARSFAIVAILWPSRKFADRELIPSGAAAAGSPVSDAALEEQLNELRGALDDGGTDAVVERARQLIPRLEDSPAAQREFADLIRSVLPIATGDIEDASEALFRLPGDEVMKRLSKPVLSARPSQPAGAGGAARAGAAAGLPQFFSGMKSAARNLLNYTTYYLMKERAGIVGRHGVNGVLRGIQSQHPDIKLHLIGHSFGGRLVTAAADGPAGQATLKLETLTLLQAAFSHHAFDQRFDGSHDGLFRTVITGGKVSGPVLITHTPNDQAVGLAYPIASLMAGQVASALGDRDDLYGGLGRNGAQKTPEASDGQLLAAGGDYEFQAGRVHNLSADAFITDHGDICRDEVAYAVLSAVATT